DYTVTLTAWFGSSSTTTTFSGSQAVVNRSESEFGAGWWLAGLDRLFVSSAGALLVESGGDSLWYAADGSGGYLSATGDARFATLVENGGGDFTLTAKSGETWNFSSLGLLTSVVDTNGNTVEFDYTDADSDSVADELAQITDPFSRTTDLSYSGGLLDSWEDFAGRVVTFGYDSGRLATVTLPDPDGGGVLASPEIDYAYDGSTGLLTGITDSLSHATTFAYDAASLRLATVTNPDSSTRELSPVLTIGLASGSGNSLTAPADAIGTLTDERDQEWTFTTDSLGDVRTSTDPLGNTTTIDYDQRGLPFRVTQADPDGSGPLASPVTLLGYNALGDNVLVVYPGGATASRTFDATLHRVLTETDELGRTWTYTLDAYGNVATAEDPAENTWSFEYDAGGRTIGVTSPDPDGAGAQSAAVTEFEYDAYGRLITQTNAD
ncbi:MAG TPA: hypothetical protein PLV92_25310, partial [Pirellulaceae bacterium]|nr:hypothetical protein [Pirellulaceae bacterium]